MHFFFPWWSRLILLSLYRNFSKKKWGLARSLLFLDDRITGMRAGYQEKPCGIAKSNFCKTKNCKILIISLLGRERLSGGLQESVNGCSALRLACLFLFPSPYSFLPHLTPLLSLNWRYFSFFPILSRNVRYS